VKKPDYVREKMYDAVYKGLEAVQEQWGFEILGRSKEGYVINTPFETFEDEQVVVKVIRKTKPVEPHEIKQITTYEEKLEEYEEQKGGK